MSAPTLASLRLLWRRVHLWIGAGLLIAIVPLSVTGAALVWRDGMERMLEPERFAAADGAARLTPSAYLQAGRAALEGRATVTQVRLPGPGGGPVVVSGRPTGGGRGNVSVWLDPATTAVRDTGAARGGLMQVMHELHGNLMIPEIGRKVVGWIGWAMLVSSVTGLWLWWPLRGNVLRGLRWGRGTGALFNLHHLIGFWICMPLALLSLTGVYVSFPQMSRAVFGVAEPARPAEASRAPAANPAGERGKGPERREGGPPGQGRPLANPHLTIDQAGAAALAAQPGASLAQITLPTEGRRPSWRVQVRTQGSAEPVNLQVDDTSGLVRASTGGPGVQDPLSRWMRRLHDGGNLPWLYKLLISIGGAAPAFLAISGVIMWLQRRGRTKPVRPARGTLQAAE